MSMTSEGLRITIRGRVRPVTDLGRLADIRNACDRVLKRNGLSTELLCSRRAKPKGDRRS